MINMQTQKLNVKFKVGQKVACTWGINKGLELTVASYKGNNYILKDQNGKPYLYSDNQLKLV